MRLILLTFIISNLALGAEVCSDVFRTKTFKTYVSKSLEAAKPESRYITRAISEEFEDIMKKYPGVKLRYNYIVGEELSLRGPVSKIKDIPFDASHRIRPKSAQNTSELVARIERLDPAMQRAFLNAYNALTDPAIVKRYLKDLYAESAVLAYRSQGSKSSFTLNGDGQLAGRSIAVTIVQRFKSRGDTKFTKITGENPYTGKYIVSGKYKVPDEVAKSENASFRMAVANGPFIDAKFPDYQAHGAYSHLIQRDLVYPHLKMALGEDVSRFYTYLGSKEGISLWIDLFDSGVTRLDSLTRPETVTEVVFGQLGRL